MPNSLLVLVLVLVQYFLVTWARWVPSTTTVTHGITTSPVRLGTFDEPEPRASATPWKRQVPISARQIASSSTPVASPSPTPTGIKLGQVVIASTRQSTLPSAICAIGPWSNGSKSALEIWGCSSGYLIGSDTLTFNSRDECISSDGRYFCVYTSTPSYEPYMLTTSSTIWTGDVELSQGTIVSYNTSSYYSFTTSYTTTTISVTNSAYVYTGEADSDYQTLTTYTQTRPSSLYYETYSIWVKTFVSETVSWSGTTYTQTSTDHFVDYSYVSSIITYTTCAGPQVYSFDQWVSFCSSGVSEACQQSTPTVSYASQVCTAGTSDNTIQAFNLNQLQATVTSMTMSLSLSKSSTDTHFYFVDMYTSETLKPTGTASTVDSSPSGYLSLIRSKPPFCVNVINSTCTSLYAASQQCWSEAFPPGPQMCLCNSLSLMNCTQICQSTPDDRVSYYDWAIELCKDYTRPLNSSINATFVSIWPEVQDRSYSILQDLYPFAWRLSPTDNKKLSQCPSKALNLASFAINNAIVGVGTWFLGRRKLIKRLASGLRWFTKAAYGVAGSKSWPAISIIVVAINVFANFINAVLAKRTAGFSSPDIGTLIRLWATRPRLAFIATAISPVQKEQSMYISAGVSTLLSEVMLQTIGGVVFIQVISFFTTRGYLQVKALQYVFGSWSAMLVYSSALIWVISISFFYIYVVWKYLIGARVSTLVFLALWNFLKSYSEISWNTLKYTLEKIVDLIQRCFRAHSDLNTEEEGYSMDDLGEVQAQPYQTKGWVGWLEQMGLGGDVLKTVSQAYIVLLLPYISQWLFWIGFVELYRDRYCVPVLWQMTLVWSVFDLICILLSATH